MTERTLTIRLRADGKRLIGTLKKTEKGIKKVGTETKKAHNHADKMKDSMGAMNNIMYAFVAIGVATKIVGVTDAMKQLNSRLKIATSSAEEYARAQRDLFNIAQTTGIQLTSVGDLYTKFARATKKLNVSQTDLALITSTVSKAIVVSGSSAQEADAALLQLSQGMASGVLRGQELNSVMEQTPRLARAIAVGMGVELGQLRKLGMAGKITTAAVVDALKNQADIIDSEFSTMTKTVSRSWIELSNSFALYLSKSSLINTVTNNLTRSFSQLASVIGDAANGIIGEQGLMDALNQADMDAATASAEKHRQTLKALNITLDQLTSAQEISGVSQAAAIAAVTEKIRKQNIMLQVAQGSYNKARSGADIFASSLDLVKSDLESIIKTSELFVGTANKQRAVTIDLAAAKKELAAAAKQAAAEFDELLKQVDAEAAAEFKSVKATYDYKKSLNDQIRILKVRTTQGKTAARVEADWIRAQDEGIDVSREYIASQYEQITAMEDFESQAKKSISGIDKITQNFYRNAQRGMGDLIYRNFKTGFSDWSNIAKDTFNTIRDGLYRLVADMIARWAMLKVAGMFGFGDGGGGGSGFSFSGLLGSAATSSAGSSMFSSGGGAAASSGGGLSGVGASVGSVGAAFSGSLANGATAAQAGVAAFESAASGAEVTVYALGTETAVTGTELTTLGTSAGEAAASTEAMGASSGVAGGAVAAWGAVAVAAYIAIAGAIDAARIDKENAKMTKEFNRLRTETDAFAGEGVKVSDTLSIIGDEMGALYVRATENENGIFPDISTFYDQLGEVGAQLRYIYDDTGEAIAMITGNIEDAQTIIEQGFDNAKLSFTEFQGATQGGLTSMDADFRGSAAEWTRVLQSAMDSGAVSSQASFQVIEDDAGNTFLRMQGQANEWANYLASQGRIASDSFADSMNYMFAEGDNMFGNLTSQARSFQSILSGIKGPSLSGNLSVGVNGSYADGLDYVPFDGFIAQLHKGERVQTAAEARGGGNNEKTNQLLSNILDRIGLLERTTQAGTAAIREGIDINTDNRPADLRTNNRVAALERVGVAI